MRILFVYPDIGTKGVNFSPAIQLLSAILKKNGFSCELLHINDACGVPSNDEAILSEIRKKRFDIALFTATSFQYTRANEIAGLIKREYSRIPILLGGTHATIKPDDLDSSSFDAFCIGEGDEALPEFIRRFEEKRDFTDVRNFHVKKPDGTIVRNEIGPFIRDLNLLPFWDMEIMDMKKILLARHKWLSISFSRGCPFECTFCINHLLKAINVRRPSELKHYIRKRKAELVVKELARIAEKLKGYIDVFNFDDDLLMLDKPYMLELTKLYREEIYTPYGIRYAMNCRASCLDEDIAKALGESGCLELRIGFETGDENLRQEMLKKGITNAELIRAFRLCDEYGIHTNSFAMIGIPGENRETVQKTVDMIIKLKPYLIRMTFLSPYFKTEIYEYCKKKNMIREDKIFEDSFTDSPLKLGTISEGDLLRYRLLFPWYINVKMCGESASLYRKELRKFEQYDFEKLRRESTFKELLGLDNKLSDVLAASKTAHYRYFRNNLYYFNLRGKYGWNETKATVATATDDSGC
ncbi:MAG: radical SAM protein [Candidatus Omnitrophica bacterium]|nr:radical SAM protein [Candidatus Omnitrophota bacterium]